MEVTHSEAVNKGKGKVVQDDPMVEDEEDDDEEEEEEEEDEDEEMAEVRTLFLAAYMRVPPRRGG